MIKIPIKEFLPSEAPAILQRMQQAVKDDCAITLQQEEIFIVLEAMTQLVYTLGKTSYVLQQMLEENPKKEQEDTMH